LFKLGTTEMLVILAILLVIFGPGKLPELAKSVGRSVTELKEGLSGKPDNNKQSGSESSQETS